MEVASFFVKRAERRREPVIANHLIHLVPACSLYKCRIIFAVTFY